MGPAGRAGGARGGAGINVPDSFTPVRGYRTWALGLGRLWSSHGPEKVAWPTSDPLRAACLKHGYPSFFNPRLPEHGAPDRDCTCGIHAVYAPWDLATAQAQRPWSLIFGRVEGWGRVAVGEKGFRAEMARPLELFFESWWDEPMWRAATRVARTYGIPLVSWETSPTEGAITG
jgi:hypothetical protein